MYGLPIRSVGNVVWTQAPGLRIWVCPPKEGFGLLCPEIREECGHGLKQTPRLFGCLWGLGQPAGGQCTCTVCHQAWETPAVQGREPLLRHRRRVGFPRAPGCVFSTLICLSSLRSRGLRTAFLPLSRLLPPMFLDSSPSLEAPVHLHSSRLCLLCA